MMLHRSCHELAAAARSGNFDKTGGSCPEFEYKDLRKFERGGLFALSQPQQFSLK
jgi:hypothetical protein